MTIKKTIKKLLFKWLFNIQRKARLRSMQRAIAEAKRITQETDKKVLIYFIDGDYKCVTKQDLKRKWKDRHFIGWTIQELESRCEIKIESYATRKNVNVGHK